MPPVLTEAASPRSRAAKSEKQKSMKPSSVLKTLEQHILLDGFKIVIDLEKSRGSYLYDAATGHRLIDLYGFFGSMPVGFNHPYFDRDDVKGPEFLDGNAVVAQPGHRNAGLEQRAQMRRDQGAMQNVA